MSAEYPTPLPHDNNPVENREWLEHYQFVIDNADCFSEEYVGYAYWAMQYEWDTYGSPHRKHGRTRQDDR